MYVPNCHPALANQYADSTENGKEFGRYNFLFHNCSDYTNELLDVADIDGMFGQIASEGNRLISIPAFREFELSVASSLDFIPKARTEGMKTVGKNISGIHPALDVAGGALALLGNFAEETTNFIGDAVDVVNDVVGEVVDVVKHVEATVTNFIADGAQKIWDWISF